MQHIRETKDRIWQNTHSVTLLTTPGHTDSHENEPRLYKKTMELERLYKM